MPHPTALALTDDGGVRIDWSDGQRRVYSARELYAANPAADARAERIEAEQKAREQTRTGPAGLQLTVIKPDEAAPRRVVGLDPVGNYAYAVRFNHGSNAGLYRLELLRSLGRELPADEGPAKGDGARPAG